MSGCFDSKLLNMKAKGLMYVVPYRKLMARTGLIVLFFICSSEIDSVTSYSFLWLHLVRYSPFTVRHQ